MNRAYYKAPIGDRQVRHRVVLTDDLICEKRSSAARRRQRQLLREFADAPHLHETGPVLFDECKIQHNGQQWVIELEGVETVVEPT